MARFHHCSGTAGTRRRLDFVVYAAFSAAGALKRDGVVLAAARRRKRARKLDLTRATVCFLAAGEGGRWNSDVVRFARPPHGCAGLGEALALVWGVGGGCPASGLQRSFGGVDHAATSC